ncbi:hypothetical protein AB1N83_011634 [Pleurotus pulmonarius]
MQFTNKIASFVILATMAIAGPAAPKNPKVSVVTDAEFDDWLRTTDAKLTFIGNASESHTRRNTLSTRIVYCNRQVGSICGGECKVYDGDETCLSAPGTACLMATSNVAFCNRSACSGTCHTYGSCATVLANGFCAAPGTSSILVPFI